MSLYTSPRNWATVLLTKNIRVMGVTVLRPHSRLGPGMWSMFSKHFLEKNNLAQTSRARK